MPKTREGKGVWTKEIEEVLLVSANLKGEVLDITIEVLTVLYFALGVGIGEFLEGIKGINLSSIFCWNLSLLG